MSGPYSTDLRCVGKRSQKMGPDPVDPEGGSALVWALLFVVVSSGMIISHSAFLAAQRRESDVRYSQEALAGNFAISGLTESLGWFRRQESQPVQQFAPILEPEAQPPVLDTIDPAIGLVREFEINGSLWGRYEVRNNEVADISIQRGITTPGSVWEVGVRSYVYRRNDPTRPFDAAPNRVVSATALTSELRGVQVSLPAVAAVNIDDASKLLLGPLTTIDGNGKSGIAYEDPGLLVALDPRIVGTPKDTQVLTYDASPEAIFGMSLGEISEYSDSILRDVDAAAILKIGRAIGSLAGSITTANDIYVEGGMLIVEGDLVTLPTAVTTIQGVLYVGGNLVLQGQADIKGAVVVRGTMMTGVLPVNIQYDEDIYNNVTDRLSKYRMPRTTTPR